MRGSISSLLPAGPRSTARDAWPVFCCIAASHCVQFVRGPSALPVLLLAGSGRGALSRLDEVVNAAEFPLVVAYSGLDRQAARLGQRPAERRVREHLLRRGQ